MNQRHLQEQNYLSFLHRWVRAIVTHFSYIHLIPFFFSSIFLLACELRRYQTSFCGRLHSHRFSHAHHKFAQNVTAPVPSDKTPNIIDIVPRQPTGAAANKDSPSLCPQWSTWIRKHHFNSAKASSKLQINVEVEGDANAAVVKQPRRETETTVRTGGHPQGEAATLLADSQT